MSEQELNKNQKCALCHDTGVVNEQLKCSCRIELEGDSWVTVYPRLPWKKDNQYTASAKLEKGQKALTDHKKAQRIIDCLRSISVLRSGPILQDLSLVVDRTQNLSREPADEGGDGSIDEDAWIVLRNLAQAARMYTQALYAARRVFLPNFPAHLAEDDVDAW